MIRKSGMETCYIFMDNSQNQSKKGGAGEILFLCVDAALYAVGIFFVQLYRLLYRDGAIGPGFHIFSAAGFAILVAAVSFIYIRRQKRRSGSVVIPVLIDVFAFLFISLAPVIMTEFLSFEKGVSFDWMPTEWLKLPRAVFFGMRVSFPFFIAYAILLAAGFVFWVRTGRSVLLWIGCVIGAAVSYACLTIVEFNPRTMMYFTVMMGPIVITCIGMVVHSHRVAARALAYVLITMAVLPFYFGIVPWFPKNVLVDRTICSLTPGCNMDFLSVGVPVPGATKLYPPDGEEPRFPLAFLREFYYDRISGILYSSYGPTCGFLRLNTKTGEMEVMEYRSLIRYLWSHDNRPFLLAPDWIYSDILKVEKESFRITGRYKMHEGIRVPMELMDDGEFLYVLSTEEPMLARYDIETLEPAGMMDFRELGLTPYSHGAYALELDPENHRAFVQLGIYDLKGTFRLVRIDTEKFEVEKVSIVMLGSTIMTMMPEKGTLLMYDYYNRTVAEVDAESMLVIRKFKGAMNCRATAYDDGRGLLYMVGTGFGEMVAVDYESGKTIKSYYLGNKAGSMSYIAEEDALIVGGGSGIYRVDLTAFTGIERKAGKP